MWLNGKPILFVVDTEKSFQNTLFIKHKITENLSAEFINFWSSFYIGFNEKVLLDREQLFFLSTFTSRVDPPWNNRS